MIIDEIYNLEDYKQELLFIIYNTEIKLKYD